MGGQLKLITEWDRESSPKHTRQKTIKIWQEITNNETQTKTHELDKDGRQTETVEKEQNENAKGINKPNN